MFGHDVCAFDYCPYRLMFYSVTLQWPRAASLVTKIPELRRLFPLIKKAVNSLTNFRWKTHFRFHDRPDPDSPLLMLPIFLITIRQTMIAICVLTEYRFMYRLPAWSVPGDWKLPLWIIHAATLTRTANPLWALSFDFYDIDWSNQNDVSTKPSSFDRWSFNCLVCG